MDMWEDEFEEKREIIHNDLVFGDGEYTKNFLRSTREEAKKEGYIKGQVDRVSQQVKVEMDNQISKAKAETKKEILRLVDEEIEMYTEIGEALQGESKTINIEKLHMAGIIRAKIANSNK